ncbi:MAG: glycine cleavage system protein H [Candidatus Firestonebacteria bacterium GWA2_43_8]|nr:MAG: glycine cleavage system protein H [Candidatus Firestonebacteria bacterium GWA2_43_8]
MFPAELKYTKSHEYVKAEGNTAIFGISQYAVDQVKDIVYLELPKVGQELRAGSPFGSLESVKAVFELMAPVSGKVTAVNEAINSSPEAVSKGPYGDGWMVKVEMSNTGELNNLMNNVDYQKHVEAEGHH